MYANYLIDVGRLVFIVGDTQSTTQFKNIFQSSGSPNKENIFYKCVQELPSETFKKIKLNDDKKGIIRKDWFNKILSKNPQMIIMVFNCTAELQQNEVWEDRLKVMIKKINKVYDMMRSNDKQQVRLRIIVLISKHTFGGVNLPQKITNFLKNYEKELLIIQVQYYAKEISKVRSQWVHALQKNYDTKYRKIQKRYEQSFLDRKLGCLVKMAILSQMLSKKDQKQRYLQTYKALRYRFSDAIKSVTILTHNKIRQLRGVADVTFLRYLKCMVTSNTSGDSLFKLTIDHMNFYKLKNLGVNQTHKYYYYEQLLWRGNFIQNFLQILYKNDLMESVPIVSLCELLNQLVTYLHALSIVDPALTTEEKNLGAKTLQQREENYIGLITYKTQQLLQTDAIYSFMNELIHHKKDYLTKGIQLITRYKTMNIFKKSQLLFLNVYLLRLYFQDNKFQSFLTTYDEIMRQQICRSNYFLLNQIFNQIQEEFKEIKQSQKVMFYGVSSLICDYFENISSLQDHLSHLLTSLKSQEGRRVKSLNNDLLSPRNSKEQGLSQSQNLTQLNQGYKFSLKKKSNIVAVSCFIKNEFVYIEDEIKLKIQLQVNKVLSVSGCKITVIFNHKSVNQQFSILPGSSSNVEKTILINPLEYFTKDQTLKIQCIKIQVNQAQNLNFVIPSNHITFIKHKQNKIYTQIKCPQIQINNPYSVYFINQVSKFQINIQKLSGLNTEVKCSIKEEDIYGKTQVFVDFNERHNLTNSNYYQQLVTKGTFLSNIKDKTINQFWLKCNKIGEKSLKLNFHFTIQKFIHKKSSDLLSQKDQVQDTQKYVLKQQYNVTKQIKFSIKDLFNIKKTFYEFSNDDSKLLQNKNIPVNKKIIAVLQLSCNQDIDIRQIGQHKNPKKIQYFKQIQKREFKLKKDSKLKLNMVFQIASEYKDQIQLYLMAIYIKWTRKQTKIFESPYENLFLDHQTKINCFISSLSIFLKTDQNYSVKKNELGKIILAVKNDSQTKNHILIQVQGTPTILRVGQKSKQIFIQPNSQKSIHFDILPIISGFLNIPNIKVYVDGIQRQMNIHSSQMIKCI